MRSFATVLIAAALATLSSTAPVAVPDKAGVSLPGAVPNIPDIDVRDLKSDITGAVKAVESKVSDVHLRAATPSVADVFDGLNAQIAPYVEQLTYLAPSNCTVTRVTDIVASIKAPIVAAVPQLQGLTGQEASTIMAPANAVPGDAKLTVSQVASTVGAPLISVITGAGKVVDVSKVQGGDMVTDVKNAVGDLNTAVGSIIGAVAPLVPGLDTALGQVMGPVDGIAAELGLSITVLGITL